MDLNKTLIFAAAALVLGATIANHPAALAQEPPSAAQPNETDDSKAEPKSAEKSSSKNSSTSPVNDDSPFDYEASEEISQDLSVSFPVDI